MFDEEAVGERWTVRLAKLTVIAGAILILGWWAIQLLGSRAPSAKSAAQQVAILRNEAEKPIPRRVAAESLADADASIVDELSEELAAGDPVGRELAAFALARMEGRAAGAADKLLAALDDAEPGVRRQTAIALGRIGARPEDAAAALVRRLNAGDVDLLSEIVRALRRLGNEGAGHLCGLLLDADADIRRRAASELGRMRGESDAEVFDSLRDALRDSDSRVRAEAYAALVGHAAIGVSDLIAGLHDADPLVRSTVSTLLSRMGPEAEPAVAELLTLAMGDAGSHAAEEALRALAREGVDLRGRLLPLLDSDDERIVERAARLLGESGRASEAIRGRLLARAGDLRRNDATWALSALHDLGLEGEQRPPELFDSLDEAGDAVHALVLWEPNSLPPVPGPRRGRREQIDRGYGISEADLARLTVLRQLRLLDLRENPIGDAGLERLAKFTQLEWLILDRTQITSAGLAHLAGLPRLRRLSLADCEIDDAGLESLVTLASLEFLDLSRTQVTDAGLAQIAKLGRLKSLWLDETAISDAGLAKLATLANLTELGVRRTRTTERGRATFAMALPEPGRRRGGARRAPRAPANGPYQVVGLADWDEPDAAPFLRPAVAR